MTEVLRFVENLVGVVEPHWSFFAAMAIFIVVGQVMKGVVFTKKRAARNVWWWRARRTMAAHPAVAGFFLGFVPGIPVSVGIETVAGKCLYYTCAGAMSAYAFAAIKSFLEAKRVEFEIPGESTTASGLY